jgi:Fe2+ transport system protein FeoA
MNIGTLTLDELNCGENAKIVALASSPLALQLLEMGFVPGESLLVAGFAPFGDPMRLRFQNFEVCIRKQDAALVNVIRI